VVWDTCRGDRVSAGGYRLETTPWLRSFAAGATVFQEAFTPSPWTPPAHASLFTGLLPRRHGLLQGRGDLVPREIPLLAETLRAAGYETVSFSSNSFVSPLTGLTRGMERVTGLYDDRWGIGNADRTLAAVRGWLEERRNAAREGPGRPLFLFVNLMDAHLPRKPPLEDLLAVSGGAVSPGATRARALDQRESLRHVLGIEVQDDRVLEGAGVVYDAALRFLDRRTGEMFDDLGREGLLEGAFVAITGDHGEHLGEHGNLNHVMSLYDGVLRIPMVVRWPGRLEGGRRVEAQVRLQDLYPTILEAAGVPVPRGTGLDAAPLTEAPIRPRGLTAEFYRPEVFLEDARSWCGDALDAASDPFHVSIFAARDPAGAPGARKLLRWVRQVGAEPPAVLREELYDLASDPGELLDLLRAPSEEDRAAARRLGEAL
jgi:arylsulfatase A-like enzyme